MKKSFVITALLCLTVLVWAYSNHFNNGFYFDDYHTIVNNSYIKDISNFTAFFTDIACFGTNPDNRTYNPVLVLLNAVDYWMAGELNPVYFHASIFASFLLLGVLLFFFIRKIFQNSFSANQANWISLFAVAFFMLHAANPETINYIIMRSDSFSTLMIVASFVLYQNESLRKWHLHLITLIIGIGTKEVGLMFVSLLPVYILLIQENISFLDIFKKKHSKSTLKVFLWSTLPLVVGFTFFFGSRALFIKSNTFLVSGDYANPTWEYLITQWYVIAHYLGNFILPLSLSVDTDFQLSQSILERKILLSLFLLLAIVAIAIFYSFKKETRPITFGIIWFFFALAPTSSIIPFAQIANDHRTFFPYIGLVISLGCYLGLKFVHYNKIYNPKFFKSGAITCLAIILLLHAYGTHQRNKVWSSKEALWGDAVRKAPNNGRIQMNYGLALMEKARYQETLPYFKKAIELLPRWSYPYLNMGILQNAMDKPELAETYFKKAISVNPINPGAYYFYARFLFKKARYQEALTAIAQGEKVAPNFEGLILLKERIKLKVGTPTVEELLSYEKKLSGTQSAEEYLNLSLSYYQIGEFEHCITAANKALKIRPDYSLAYNNICSAEIALENWNEAEAACQKAIELNPQFERAKNNLALIRQAQGK